MFAKYVDLGDVPEDDVRLGEKLLADLAVQYAEGKPALAAVLADVSTAFENELKGRQETLERLARSLPETTGIVGAVAPDEDDDVIDGEPAARLVAEADRCFMDMARQVSDGRSALFMWRNDELHYRAVIDEVAGTVSYDALLPDGNELEGLFTVEFSRNHARGEGLEEDE